MTSQPSHSDPAALITVDREIYESCQQELATLRQDNERLRGELARCRQYHELLSQRLSAASEAKDAQQIKALFAAEGAVCRICGISTDISDRRREERRAETQYAVTRILSDASDLSEAIPQILQIICDSLDWDFSEFWSVDDSANLLRCAEIWHRPGIVKPEFTAATRSVTFVPGVGLPGRVRVTGKPVWIADVVHDSNFLRATAAAQEGLHGACAFPVVSDQDIFGVFVFFSQKSQPHVDQDWLKVMMALGRQIGQFIKRRQAEEQLQQQAKNLKQALRKLRKTQSQLIQTEKMSSLGQLVAGVAHEINNPVNFIHANVEHLRQYSQEVLELLDLYRTQIPIPPPTIEQRIEEIDLAFIQDDLPRILTSMKVGTDRIREIVQSLRTFSRLDEAEMKVVDLHEGINSTLMILGNRLKAKPDYPEIQVIKNYSNLPQVECYPGQLNQVFMNILCNAIDALEGSAEFKVLSAQASKRAVQQAPTIRICTEVADQQRVRIIFADNGPGMTETVRKRLFDPFFTTKPVGKGTGMGMSISYQIIAEKHRGSLQCISSPGQGAKFIIEIPVQQ